MKIDWNIIDRMLQGELESDDCSIPCKEEIAEFLQTHNMDVFSDESLEFLSAIWNLVYKEEYENLTGTKIPNIFKVITQPETEEVTKTEEEVIDER